ncbi:MAG TPA: methyltransferase domain-containing protein [Burkholderiales bacterium]|jgi:SAM-dependent methyltransferase|nr:methyltransferase domain-containing protein [Burkholderiales bacterium]
MTPNGSLTADLQAWFETPLGAYLLASEQSYFDQEVADVFGFNALQLGMCKQDFLRANRMPFHCRVSPLGPDGHGAAQLRSDLHALPILSNSADLVLLPHVLEFSDSPHQVLREVVRILMPEGHVIVSGFNPWSLWGARQAFDRRSQELPWCGQFINLPRLKDWMALLGIEIAAGRMCCYIPPVVSQRWIERLSFLEASGDRWWPFAGGVYFLHGVKRVPGMRVITPQWKVSRAKSKSLATIPQRVQDSEEQLAARARERVRQKK